MSIKRVAGITALITAMAFVNSVSDLTIIGNNNVCYAKVVRRITRNVLIQKKSQPADNAQSPTQFVVKDIITEPSHAETGDTPDSETVRVDKTTDNKNLKKNQDLSLVTAPANGIDNRLGDTTVQIEQYMKANPQSGFSVISALTDYDQYGEYLNNNYKTYVFKTNNFNAPITEPITVNGNLIIEEGMYIALQSDSYELTVNGNLIIRGNGSIKCCMEKANATGLNTVQVKGNIVFDGNTHKMSFTEQSYGFTMPANYARSTQKLNFASNGTWYAVNGKSDDYYNLKQVSKTQTKYFTNIPKPDVPSVFDKKGNGDVNGDSVVNDADVELLRKYLTDIVGENAIDKKNADLNGDGKVTLTDLSQLKTMVEESKVKSPLIILTNEEINTKYSQYKKYLTKSKTYYVQGTDWTSLIDSNGGIVIDGNVILDKQLKSIDRLANKIEIQGSLIFIKNAGGRLVASDGKGSNCIHTILGTLYYNPDKNVINDSYRGPNLYVDVYGDIYVMSNPYSRLSERKKYGDESLIIRYKGDRVRKNVYFAPDAYMHIYGINGPQYINFLSNMQCPDSYTSIYYWDDIVWGLYYSDDRYFKNEDNQYIKIIFTKFIENDFIRIGGVQADLISSKYKGRISALTTLLLQDESSAIEKLPFLKVERANNNKKVSVVDIYGKELYYIKISQNANTSWKGYFGIAGKEYQFDILIINGYRNFKEKLAAILKNPSIFPKEDSGYSAIIRSIFECGVDYGLTTIGSYRSFGFKNKVVVNKYGEKYSVYPMTECLNIASPYVNHIFMKGQRPYDYGIKSPEPNPSQDTILSPEDLQAKLDVQEEDLYKIIVNAIGDEYGNKQAKYEMEGLEELKKNIKLTNNVKLDDDIYMAFLEPLKKKISDTIIKKYDSKVGINFVFDISNMLYTGLEKVKDRKVTSGGKVYTLKYDMSWAVHGILVASATLYDYKNSEVTKMTLTNLDTEEGAKNLAQYATGLAILNKEVEENAIYEVMKEVFKEITNDRNTASKLTKTLKFGQEITSAMLTDEAAKNFAKDRGEALKELIDKKGQGHIFNTARNCVRGIVEKYVPNGKNIVKAVDQIDKINKTITKYSNIYKTYNSYNSKTSADELKKMELEFNSYSEALSKIFSAIR